MAHPYTRVDTVRHSLSMNPSAHSETADGVRSPSSSDRKRGSNREAQKLAHDLVLKAQALSSSVQKMPPSSPIEDARRGFNLKHLNILASRFAELAALSTELEDENTQLRRKLAKAEKDLKISHYEKLDLERELRTVKNDTIPKMKSMRREIIELKRENVHMSESLEELLSQSDTLSKRAKQGEIVVVKLQNVCRRLVEDLNKAKVDLMAAKALGSSPTVGTPGSVRPLAGTPQALYDGGFRDVSHFQQYVAKMEERKVELEEERLKAKAIRHDDRDKISSNDASVKIKSSLQKYHTIPSPSPKEKSVEDPSNSNTPPNSTTTQPKKQTATTGTLQ